ncbi:MAG: hypothetical protein IKU45_01050 [Clostridia bacterium]|nr:hypothetical protein [Clostridia bacterium]
MTFDASKLDQEISNATDQCHLVINCYQSLNWNDSVYRSFHTYSAICSEKSVEAEDCKHTCIMVCNKLTSLEIEQTLAKIESDISESKNAAIEAMQLLAEIGE